MAAPVWVLSVDLQTKTATFQTGMADAAKSARGAFNDIKGGAGDMASTVGSTAGSARQGVMLLGQEFGLHLPRGITTFIASLGPVGAAMEAAFPFVAVAAGAVILMQHLAALKAEGQQLTMDQVKFGTAAQMAFNALDQKLTQAQIKSDELKNDHLGALHNQLKLIDEQSMAELVHSFGEVAKAAEVVFGDIKSHWYSLGIGAEGAKHALDGFQTQYESLIAQGKEGQAHDLLSGTLESAQKVLSLQQQFGALQSKGGKLGLGLDKDEANKMLDLRSQLSKVGLGGTENEVKAQQTLVDALNSQLTVEQKIKALNTADKGNATQETGNQMAALSAEGARLAAEHKQKMGELALANEREQAGVELTIARATIAQRLAVDTEMADKQLAIQLAGNRALINALDRSGKDYQNQLRGLQNKAEEMTAEHANTVSALENKAHLDAYNKAIGDLEQSEREKVEATEQGSAARLAAIDEAMRGELALGLTDTQRYKELQTQRVEVQRQAADEAAKLAAEAGKEQAEQTQRMGELALAMEHEQWAVRDSARRMTVQQRIAEETQASNEEYQLKLQALAQEESALDKGSKEHQNKLKEIQDKEKQLQQQHENDITAIKDKAEIERNQKILAAEQKYMDSIASGLTQAIMGQKSFASVMQSIGSQVETDLLQAALKHIETNLLTKQSDASTAAAAMFRVGTEFGFPGAIVMAPLLGAAAYATTMAFEGGGIVPGVGRGDIVPAMLEPGEGIVPNSVMGRLDDMTRNGGGGDHYHMTAHFAPKVQAFDSAGVDKVLDKHAAKFQQHFESAVRRMNR